MRQAAPWVALGAAIAALALALAALGFPSPTLFAALLVGLAYALARPGAGRELPGPALLYAQAVVGITLGSCLHVDALRERADDWLPVGVVSAATLGISIGVRPVLASTCA